MFSIEKLAQELDPNQVKINEEELNKINSNNYIKEDILTYSNK